MQINDFKLEVAVRGPHRHLWSVGGYLGESFHHICSLWHCSLTAINCGGRTERGQMSRVSVALRTNFKKKYQFLLISSRDEKYWDTLCKRQTCEGPITVFFGLIGGSFKYLQIWLQRWVSINLSNPRMPRLPFPYNRPHFVWTCGSV